MNKLSPVRNTVRRDTDVVIAVVKLTELAEFKAAHGLRTVGGAWPAFHAKPILYVEPIQADSTQETK